MQAPLKPTDPIVLAFAFTVAASLIFWFFPQIDIATTNVFYRGESGFPFSQNPIANGLRTLSENLAWVIVALCVVSLIASLIGRRSIRLLPPRGAIFVLAVYAIGVGLVVNVLLKNQWGRPRPIQTDLFGGNAPYVPVWQMTDYCETNCSFVSGEASTAFWFVTLTLFVPTKWRLAAFLFLFVFASVLSVNRIAFGAHFLSDVLIAWGLMALMTAIFHRVLIRTHN